MEPNLPVRTETQVRLRIFGVGDAGMCVVDRLIADGMAPEDCVAVNTGGPALEKSAATRRVQLENKRMRGLGSGGDPARGRLAAEEKQTELQALCEAVDVIFIIAGLGGGAGTGISPVLARIAKASGALVLAFVTMPFDCEGIRRQQLAEEGIQELRDNADGTVCLPNQRIFKLIEQNTTVVETFKVANRLLADAVSGVWRLLSLRGLIEIPVDELCRLLQDRHCESTFAVAEASGPDRATRVLERILSHPLLEEGALVSTADVLLVCLTGGPNLTMAEVSSLVEELKAKSGSAEIAMGASIDEHFGDRLVVTLIASSKLEPEVTPRSRAESLDTQLLERGASSRPSSRFLPPAPNLPPDQVQKLLAKQGGRRHPARRTSAKMRQGQLPLEIVSKGRFDKSEPTIHKGEDLDVPTYIRRGVPLN